METFTRAEECAEQDAESNDFESKEKGQPAADDNTEVEGDLEAKGAAL